MATKKEFGSKKDVQITKAKDKKVTNPGKTIWGRIIIIVLILGMFVAPLITLIYYMIVGLN